MERKNQLINLKIIMDTAIKKLNDIDKKVLYIKMNYNLQMNDLCGILELKERTAFRRVENAFKNFADELNRSKHISKLLKIIREEEWIQDIRDEIIERRMAFRNRTVSC